MNSFGSSHTTIPRQPCQHAPILAHNDDRLSTSSPKLAPVAPFLPYGIHHPIIGQSEGRHAVELEFVSNRGEVDAQT
jgi:hypothetical protein